MSVTVTREKTIEVRYHTCRIEFDGAAPILLERRYSHGGKEFLPDSAFARWNHGSEVEDITVSGYVLKKDRTIGQQRTEMRYVTPAARGWNTAYCDNAPAWVLELFGIEAEVA